MHHQQHTLQAVHEWSNVDFTNESIDITSLHLSLRLNVHIKLQWIDYYGEKIDRVCGRDMTSNDFI